ncbi:MAG: RidA family protein, partial [Rhodospirillaceae bacterium]|nr:RidA family protein [Rhodospirillaceae bacterium]
LDEGGMGVDDVVKINGYVVGAENFPAYAAGRKKVMGDARPASTAIIVPALAMPKWLVEIEVIAAK